MSYPDGDLGTAIPASRSQHHHHDVSTAAARRRGGATRFASGSGSPFQELGNPAPSGSRMQPVGSCVVRVPHPRRPEIPMARRAAFHRATDAWRIGLPPRRPVLDRLAAITRPRFSNSKRPKKRDSGTAHSFNHSAYDHTNDCASKHAGREPRRLEKGRNVQQRSSNVEHRKRRKRRRQAEVQLD